VTVPTRLADLCISLDVFEPGKHLSLQVRMRVICCLPLPHVEELRVLKRVQVQLFEPKILLEVVYPTLVVQMSSSFELQVWILSKVVEYVEQTLVLQLLQKVGWSGNFSVQITEAFWELNVNRERELSIIWASKRVD